MNEAQMKHLKDEELVDVYYGELDGADHLTSCAECRQRFGRLQEVLDAFDNLPIPARDVGHGSEVWTSLLPKLPSERTQRWWLRWWVWMPAMAVLLAISFVTGRITEHRNEAVGISEKARERVLLMSVSDHLEQSQIVLENVANAGEDSSDLGNERDRAHELLGANRLLRQTAARLGDNTDAALLDELERVLLDIANSPDHSSAADLERTQEQIAKEGLLFRVRVTSVASRERGGKL